MPALEPLLEYLHDAAGESLRAVGMFDDDERRLIYHREDLDSDSVHDRLERIADNITWEWQPPEGDLDAELGSMLASLQVRADAIVLHLPVNDGDDRGILIGLEPEAARNLSQFIVECMDRVEEIGPVS